MSARWYIRHPWLAGAMLLLVGLGGMIANGVIQTRWSFALSLVLSFSAGTCAGKLVDLVKRERRRQAEALRIMDAHNARLRELVERSLEMREESFRRQYELFAMPQKPTKSERPN